MFAVIDEYATLSPEHATLDPYRQFPLLDTRAVYNRFGARKIVRVTDIVCHFAALVCSLEGIPEPCMVVRALDRVRVLSTHTRHRITHNIDPELIGNKDLVCEKTNTTPLMKTLGIRVRNS